MAFVLDEEMQNVTNIKVFDVRYEMIQRWPMPGRRFAVTFKYKM